MKKLLPPIMLLAFASCTTARIKTPDTSVFYMSILEKKEVKYDATNGCWELRKNTDESVSRAFELGKMIGGLK